MNYVVCCALKPHLLLNIFIVCPNKDAFTTFVQSQSFVSQSIWRPKNQRWWTQINKIDVKTRRLSTVSRLESSSHHLQSSTPSDARPHDRLHRIWMVDVCVMKIWNNKSTIIFSSHKVTFILNLSLSLFLALFGRQLGCHDNHKSRKNCFFAARMSSLGTGRCRVCKPNSSFIYDVNCGCGII